MLEYFYNEEQNFLHLKPKPAVIIDDIAEHYQNLLENNSYPERMNVLIDCVGIELKVNIQKIGLIVDMVVECTKKYELLREGMLVDLPYETAFANLYRYSTQIENYEFEIFSTREAALNWLIGQAFFV